MAGDGFVHLNEEQLRELANHIHSHEVEAMRKINWKSQHDYLAYHNECQDAHDSAVGILDAGVALKDQSNNDELFHIHRLYMEYIFYALDTALQGVAHCSLRKKFLREISNSVSLFTKCLEELDVDAPDFLVKAERLAKAAQVVRDEMYLSSGRMQSTASRAFSKMLAEKKITFEDLVKRYKRKLYPEFYGPFDDLNNYQKKWVYDSIIDDAGRGGFGKLEQVEGFLSIGVLAFTSFMIVVDICIAEHKVQTGVSDFASTLISAGCIYLGNYVEGALVTWAGLEATSWTVMALGFIAGFAGGILLGLIATALIDLYFNSGGNAKLSTSSLKTDEHKCYFVNKTDGLDLARRIAYRDSQDSGTN